MKSTILIIAASALVSGLAMKAAPALSQTTAADADVNVSIVRTADLDLSTQEGRRLLDRRLVIAAGEVCGTASDVDLKGKNEVRKCRDEVLTAARARVQSMSASNAREPIVIAARR